MKKNDQMKLNDILEFNRLILKQYNKLAEMEINGKLNDDDYKKELSYIDLISEVTNNKIESLTATPKEMMDYEESLAIRGNYNGDDDDIILEMLCNNLDYLPEKRLSMQLFYYSLNHHIYVIDDVYTNDEFEEISDEADILIEDDVSNDLDFYNLKDRIINHTFFEYLLEAIQKEEDKEIKEALIKTKYYALYLLTSIERKFINNPTNFANAKLFQDTIANQNENVDLEEEYILPNEETIYTELKYIASLKNEYFDKKENIIKVYLMILYLKTYISINISYSSIKRINAYKDKLKVKSTKSKEFIDKAFNVNPALSRVKKVDL